MNEQQRSIELINKEIDNAISPREHDELQTYLSRNPEMQQYYHHMMSISAALDSVEEVHPSGNLKKRVMNSVKYSEFKPQQQSSFFSSLRMPHLFRYKYAYTFAAGIMCGLVVFFVATMKHDEKPLAPTQLYGTMFDVEKMKDIAPYSHIEIALNEVSGNISVRRNGNIIFMEVGLQAKKQVEVNISYGSDDIQVEGVAQFSGVQHPFVVSRTSMKLLANGTVGYQILLKNVSSSYTPLHVALYDGGTVLTQRTFGIGETKK